VVARTGKELWLAAEQAAAGEASIVVAGGGDGTIAAVASTLVDTPKALAVLPLGTFNYFAQQLGVPLDLDGALDVVTSGIERRVGVGEVNGRVFLNNSSIGIYPAILQRRESTYRRVGRSRVAAYLSAALVLSRAARFLHLQLAVDGAPIVRRTPLLFVGTNAQQMESFAIPGGECLASGRLALYMTRPLRSHELWRLALRGFARGLREAGELEVVCAREVHVTLRGKRVRVAMDGEIAKLRAPLRYRFRENALRVLAPAP
jgi:diacylglycerol kinase family enzyme